MKEQLISIETAKLIPHPKNDAFWNHCEWYYVDTTTKNGYWMGDRGTPDIDYPAPTQSLLQKWLRDKHNIKVLITWGYAWEWNVKTREQTTFIKDGTYNTYEEALEDGLKQALNLNSIWNNQPA